MAMSLKKITAIAVGGAMVASTLASGVVAGEVVEITKGDIAEFVKNIVKDGEPNVEIVVGSKAAAEDVVSAADIAAWVGSMCYRDATVEDGLAELSISVSADSELSGNISSRNETILVVAPEKKYVTEFLKSGVNSSEFIALKYPNNVKVDEDIARLTTLIRDTDADPNDVDNDDESEDAIEFLVTAVYNDTQEGGYAIKKEGMLYGTLMFVDNSYDNLHPLCIGMEIPFLGETYRIVDVDDKKIYLGKEVYASDVREGENPIDIGDGYQVYVKAILQTVDSSDVKAFVEIRKDGKVVKSKSDTTPYVLRYKDIGVIVYNAYKDIPEQYGYASLIITKNVKEHKLGEEFKNDWELCAIILDGGKLKTTTKKFDTEGTGNTKEIKSKENDGDVYGLALKYVGDKIDDIEDDTTVEFVNNVTLEFTDDGYDNSLYARYKMEESKDVTLGISKKIEVLNTELELKDIKATAQQVVPVKTPIAELDEHTSLDPNKYQILVGGPVANKLSEELQKKRLINITNDSKPTLQVVDEYKVLVVAGGDRHKTREAALYLIQNY